MNAHHRYDLPAMAPILMPRRSTENCMLYTDGTLACVNAEVRLLSRLHEDDSITQGRPNDFFDVAQAALLTINT